MTNATICGAGRGPCNDPTLGEFLLIKEIVRCPKCRMATDVGLAAHLLSTPQASYGVASFGILASCLAI